MACVQFSKSLFSFVIVTGIFSGCSQDSQDNRSASRAEPNTHTPPIQNELHIPIAEDPLTLDPRLVRDLSTATLMHMLYEGLMRTGVDGAIEPAIAKSIEISPDTLTYTFTL